MFLLNPKRHRHHCTHLAISIHPMFLLNGKLSGVINTAETYFNTSHVSIKPCFDLDDLIRILISIHPMFLLNSFQLRNRELEGQISIHPMFLLNLTIAVTFPLSNNISIHPMFLLNAGVNHCHPHRFRISIQPMFLLNPAWDFGRLVL